MGGHCLPLDRIDFERAPLSGLSGWPLSFDDLFSFYQTASEYCDIGEVRYGLDSLADFSHADLLIPQENRIETRLIRQSGPTNFGEKYHDAFEASQNVDLWLYATAIGVDIDESGRASSVEARTIDGEPISFRVGSVVLAGGAIENARFLLANNVLYLRPLIQGCISISSGSWFSPRSAMPPHNGVGDWCLKKVRCEIT